LHYASMHGRLDMLDTLLQADPSTIDLIDHDNFTPLIHSIIHGHLSCVQRLLAASARIDPASEAEHIPLNLACEHGAVEIVELLLQHGARILADAEGLYPQHLVARSGQTPQLLRLLQRYNADLDQCDKLYGWTPLFHAASEGNVPCLQELLNVGANANIADEKDLPAVYCSLGRSPSLHDATRAISEQGHQKPPHYAGASDAYDQQWSDSDVSRR